MKSGVDGPTGEAKIFAFSFCSLAALLMAIASCRWPELRTMSALTAFAACTSAERLVAPFLYFLNRTTFMPLVGAYVLMALATSRLKLSSALSIATVVGLGLSVAAMSITPWRYLLAGLSTPKVYLYPWLKIDCAAPLASTIGIWFSSAIAASVAVAALP